MTEKKQFHLKIKWKNREKTEAHEIVLYDGGQPLCELICVDDARLVRDIMNEQEETIQEYKHLVKIATSLIEWNTIPQIRREWKKHLSKVGDVDD